MRKLVPFVLLLAVVACKKKEPEVAATPADPATTVNINITGNSAAYERVRVVCRDQDGEKFVGPLTEGKAVVSGVSDVCKAQLMPGEVTLGDVKGGSTLDCIINDEGQVTCRGGE
ncbi:MAG: hypothetical protein IPO67_09425 [Deltaproteobacteria bacterium]|nr:hypothetical protein [Deltaproteobacteria bacterium]MBK9645351.1 hypothetical protein [Deltaproteobacteria bacterium]